MQFVDLLFIRSTITLKFSAQQLIILSFEIKEKTRKSSKIVISSLKLP